MSEQVTWTVPVPDGSLDLQTFFAVTFLLKGLEEEDAARVIASVCVLYGIKDPR